jgi:GTP-binding protein Era
MPGKGGGGSFRKGPARKSGGSSHGSRKNRDFGVKGRGPKQSPKQSARVVPASTTSAKPVRKAVPNPATFPGMKPLGKPGAKPAAAVAAKTPPPPRLTRSGRPVPSTRAKAAPAPASVPAAKVAAKPAAKVAPKPAAKAAPKAAPKVQQKPAPRKPARVEPPRPAPEGPPRSGFALLLGKPNVGKSTLLNRLVGEHVAIVSPKPQTTRSRLLGFVNRPSTQLVLVDAPGVHKAKGLLNRAMVEAAMSAVGEVDVILYLAEAGWPEKAEPGAPEVDVVGPFHRELLQEVQKSGKPVVLVLTKIDLLPKPKLLPVMQAWNATFPFKEIYPLSGLTGENVDRFVDVIRSYLPEGGPLFATDQITDQPERALVAEYIREQLFLQTRDEVPYGTAVMIETFDESDRPEEEEGAVQIASILAADPAAFALIVEDEEEESGEEAGGDEEAGDVEDVETGGAEEEAAEDEGEGPVRPKPLGPGLVRIEATIIVERPSHKGIIIGKGGEMLRVVGTAARQRIERLLGCRVWLGLHVRVIPGWTEKRAMLSELGIHG